MGVIFLLLAPLLFNASAYYSGMDATLVIGQPDMFSNAANQGGSISSNTLNGPGGAIIVGNQLLVADNGNNRVLIFNAIPTSANASANTVIGQSGFSTGGGGCTQTTVNIGEGSIYSVNGKLFIADTNNNRVLIYNTIPTSNGAKADVVIGQQNFTSCGINQTGTVGPNTLQNPTSVASNGTKLLIADRGNNRVLIFNTIPTGSNASANTVIGQSVFTTKTANTFGLSNSGLASPSAIAVNSDGRLIIGDLNNNRTLNFGTIPTTSSASADSVLGQPNFTSNSLLSGGTTVTGSTFKPYGLAFDTNGRLYGAERTYNRVLIFNSVPAANNPVADIVLGQFAFNTSINNTNGLNPGSLSGPQGVFATSSQLIVSDTANNRVIIYPNATAQPNISLANSTVGQPDGPLLRLTGTASVDTNYTIRNVEDSVNYGTWDGVQSADGSFYENPESFYFDFDPTLNNPPADGSYNVRIRVTDNNNDILGNAFYFQPFALNSPAGGQLLTTSLPVFDFSVSTQHTAMRDNVTKYAIYIKRVGTTNDWLPYLDNIPVDFASVKGNSDNKNAATYKNTTTNNGIYENASFHAVYSQESSEIQVNAIDSNNKSFFEGGKTLPSGSYQWKVDAFDNGGHIQETQDNTGTFRVNSLDILSSTSFFPLTISHIDSIGSVDLSSIHPSDIQKSYTLQTLTPTFTGIVAANATVTLQLTDQNCPDANASNCTVSYTTTGTPTSRYLVSIPNGDLHDNATYSVFLSAYLNDNYVELPSFEIATSTESSKNTNTSPNNLQSYNIKKFNEPLNLLTVLSKKRYDTYCSLYLCL